MGSESEILSGTVYWVELDSVMANPHYGCLVGFFRCRIFEGRNNHLPLNETSLSYKLRLVGVFRKDLTFGLKAAFSWNPNLVDKHPHVQYFGNKAFIFICNRKARQHVRT